MLHPKPQLSSVEAISELHDVSRFDCGGHESLNDWLRRFALSNQKSESARTYVVHRNRLVVGYYSISDIVSARAVLVHAIDEPAKKFYLHFGFEPSPIHELQLMLLMKDLRKALDL